MKYATTILLVALLFCAATICNAQDKIKPGDVRFAPEAFFAKTENTKPIGRLNERITGRWCVILPDTELSAVGLYKDQVLAKSNGGKYDPFISSALDFLQCLPGTMFFVPQKKWAGFQLSLPDKNDDKEQKVFVQQAEQKITDEIEAAIPQACKIAKAFTNSHWGMVSTMKKADKEAYYEEARKLNAACEAAKQPKK